jgi:hypothetical protein
MAQSNQRKKAKAWHNKVVHTTSVVFKKSHTVHNLREIVAGQNNKNSTGTENPKILSL